MSNTLLNNRRTKTNTIIRDINGKGFDLADTYTFSVISFSAAGGDDYPIIDVESTQLTDAAVLREFFVKNPGVTAANYAPVDGELIYMSNGLEVKGCPAN